MGFDPVCVFHGQRKSQHLCADCGEWVSVCSGLICVARVTHYFMCQDCDRYWKEKAK